MRTASIVYKCAREDRWCSRLQQQDSKILLSTRVRVLQLNSRVNDYISIIFPMDKAYKII